MLARLISPLATTLLALGTACGTSGSASPSTPPDNPTAAAVTDAPSNDGAATLHTAVVGAAREASGVTKMKLRLDASGALVKQSVYHGDQSRIAQPARDLAASKFPGSKATRFENEWYAEHGEVHEVEVETADGKHCEVATKTDGTELYVECHETEASLPDPVRAAIKAAFPEGKVLEAESKKGPGVDELTIEVESGGTEYYLVVTPDGAVTNKLRRIPAVVEVPVD